MVVDGEPLAAALDPGADHVCRHGAGLRAPLREARPAARAGSANSPPATPARKRPGDRPRRCRSGRPCRSVEAGGRIARERRGGSSGSSGARALQVGDLPEPGHDPADLEPRRETGALWPNSVAHRRLRPAGRRGDREPLDLVALDQARDQARGLRLLDEIAQEGGARLARAQRPDRLLDRGELAIEDPRPRQLLDVLQEARLQARERVQLLGGELLESGIQALRLDQFGVRMCRLSHSS